MDWRHEAARMGKVFSNAYCTMAASSTTSSMQGFFDRPDRPPSFATLQGPGGASLSVSECLENFHRDVEKAPLNRRGWVFQERVLSRRTLHFTKTQVYWECGSAVYSERLIKLANPHAALLGDSSFPDSILPFYKGGRQTLFQVLYKQYSALEFSHITDRSVACSGLEQRLAQAFKTRCSFGLFERYLQRSLLWYRQDGSYLKRIDYPSNRKIPSWSWMAYVGPIDYMVIPFDSVDWHFNFHGLFSSGQTHLGDMVSSPSCRVSSRSLELCEGESVDRVRFDEHGTVREKDFRCVVLGKDKDADLYGERVNYVMFIAENSNEPGKYRRKGVGWLLDRHIHGDERDVMLH